MKTENIESTNIDRKIDWYNHLINMPRLNHRHGTDVNASKITLPSLKGMVNLHGKRLHVGYRINAMGEVQLVHVEGWRWAVLELQGQWVKHLDKAVSQFVLEMRTAAKAENKSAQKFLDTVL